MDSDGEIRDEEQLYTQVSVSQVSTILKLACSPAPSFLASFVTLTCPIPLRLLHSGSFLLLHGDNTIPSLYTNNNTTTAQIHNTDL